MPLSVSGLTFAIAIPPNPNVQLPRWNEKAGSDARMQYAPKQDALKVQKETGHEEE